MSRLNLKPSREARANLISTTVFHYSHKLKRQVCAESNLEWDMIILLDHDETVKDYCEQVLPSEIKDIIKWTPDFVVLFTDGKKMVIECKYLIDLLDPEKKRKFQEKYENMSKKCKLYNIEFIVVTDKAIHKTNRINNCRKYMEAIKNISLNPNIVTHILTKIKIDPGITLRSLINHFEELFLSLGFSREDVMMTLFNLIYQNTFIFDFDEMIDLSSKLFTRKKDETRIESLTTWLKRPNWAAENVNIIESIKLIDLHNYSDKQLQIASKRYEIIEPILYNATRQLVKLQAEKHNSSPATIWRWINKYRSNSDIRALIPRGKREFETKNFHKELLEIGIQEYLKLEKPTLTKAYHIMCSKAFGTDFKIPSYSTFRRQTRKINTQIIIKKREGRRAIEKRTTQNFSSFPHQHWALQSVQIDYTPLDVLVVDKDNRLVLGRPYLTIALDIHSRCVLGYTITFDKPSRLSIALTLLNCVTSKKSSLLKVRNVYPELGEKLKEIENNNWSDVFGLPFTLHMDNGSDFRSKDIINFGLAYNVKLQYRPVKGARYGAHVERFLGTLNHRLHCLKGTTFSNVKERGEYPSHKKAIYTIDELEARVITEIVYYHMDFHSGIKTTPLTKWQESFSTDHSLVTYGRNLPKDMTKFQIDILPSERRTIQKSGISLFNIQYNDAVLQKWIMVREPGNEKKKRKFIIRYDPRDIRYIFFYDPTSEVYYKINATEILFSRLFHDHQVSIWEYRAVSSSSSDHKNINLDEKLRIIAMQQEMEEITENKTQSQRIAKAKRGRRKITDNKGIKTDNHPIIECVDDEEIIPFDCDPEKIRKKYVGIWDIDEEEKNGI